ncbi:MAG: sigma 54-interacting transcriptional regulator, partial [Deltaproteobacteria bacterium]|nr:sigma 54-interacting transcriptional regulator [Deltaproteobacteria bacterium]
DKKFIKKSNIKSLVSVPVSAAGKVIGSFSISTVTRERKWDKELIQRLKLVGEIFANTLLRQKFEESLSKAFSEIKQLKDKIEAERDYLRDEINLEYNYENIVGDSQILKYALFKVEQVAPTDATVLILGETGTGKELIARAIHGASSRKDRPFIKLNCATLPENLIESELFGHEKGAFTGAEIRREGRFELANRGTLFLDEIGEIPQKLQAKLLRVLQDGEFERLGSSRTITVDVRIIAATNRDLEKEVQDGQFREDLWYRLNVYPITVPPLRQRKEDIPLLVRYFVDKLSRKNGKKITSISKPAMEYYKNYNWPGNIRELENVIERAIINSQHHVLRISERQPVDCIGEASGKRRESLAKMERDYIVETLEDTNWKITGENGAAAILDLNPSTLRGRMRKLGIERPKLKYYH